jgi:tRNA(Ile)-lysidine synthase
MLGLSARRLQRARAAVEAGVEAFLGPAAGNAHADPCGFFRFDRVRLRAAPMEIAVRAMTRAILAAGGAGEPVALAKVEAIAEALCGPVAAGSWTLARALISATAGSVVVEREPGRDPLPVLALAPGEEALWDGRFWVRAEPGLEASLEVRALGSAGVREVRKAGASVPAGAPAGALRALPGFWQGAELLAVPCLAFWPSEPLRARLAAEFTALRRYNSKWASAGPEEPDAP